MNAEELRAALRCGKSSCQCVKGTLTHCPAHDDSKPSMNVNDRAGTVLFHCHTGCDSKAVIAALTERGLWPLSERVRPINSRNEPDHLYRYMNADGVVVGEKGRWDNPKRFAWRMPGETEWTGGPQMDAMPLYNFADVLRSPAAPVFLVEGEKAVEACQVRGLVAVCLAGGAAQTRFGNALDPLISRDVILWPDNDDAGQALMGRISNLLPDARWVRPLVPPKGDAFDYFAAGGTVESLSALLKMAQPSVAVTGYDSLRVAMPAAGGMVRFDFAQMVASSRTLECAMRVAVEVIGSQRRSPYAQRVNLYSASALEGHVRTLKLLYPNKALDWTSLVVDAAGLCSETWRGIDRSVSANDVPLVEVREWLVEGLIPLNTVTIPFGMGGSLKSLLMAWLAVCSYYGFDFLGLPTRTARGVLVVDYEDTAEEWRLRLEELCGALHMPVPDSEAFRWMPGAGIPLVDQADTIRRICETHGIELLIIDSAISAVGGDLLDTAPAQRLMNVLMTLNLTSCLIAHNTKAENTDYPYGHIFWHNLPRATIYVEAQGTSGDKVRDVGLYPKKASRGARSPLGARVTFAGDGEPLTIETLQHAPVSVKEDESVGVKWTLIEALRGGDATIPELVSATGHAAGTVDQALRRNAGYFVATGKRGRAVTWGLLDESRGG